MFEFDAARSGQSYHAAQLEDVSLKDCLAAGDFAAQSLTADHGQVLLPFREELQAHSQEKFRFQQDFALYPYLLSL